MTRKIGINTVFLIIALLNIGLPVYIAQKQNNVRFGILSGQQAGMISLAFFYIFAYDNIALWLFDLTISNELNLAISFQKAAIVKKMMSGISLKWFIPVLLMIGLLFFSMPWVFGTDADPNSIKISVNAEDETLTNVLERISQASGYKIEFDQEWGGHLVNIQLKNESLEDALSRILANLNHALIWNDSEKKISIFINGEVRARGSRTSPSVSGSSGSGGSGTVSRGSSLRRRPGKSSSRRVPSQSSERVSSQDPDEIREPSSPESIEPTSVDKSRGRGSQSDRDLPVSVSGGKTRFGQGTSTID